MTPSKPEWQVIVDLLRDTNPVLLNRIGRKMMNYLFKRNIRQIELLMKQLESSSTDWEYSENQPIPKLNQSLLEQIVDEVFQIAAREIRDEEINAMVTQWLKHEQFRFLTMAAEKRDVTLGEITEAVQRFSRMPESARKLSP
jgi:hypothetical protein